MKEHNELQQRLATAEAERDRLRRNTVTFLQALEVKEIDDLMTKTEKHFGKLGEVIKDSIVEKTMEADRLKAENERLLRCLADYPAGNQTEPDVKAALREVDGGKNNL